MAVFNTTDYIDTSVHFKSQLKKNFVNDNHWIESYQNKINYAWNFASNVADIEESVEEKNDDGFLKAFLDYKTVEVRITSAYNEKGAKMSDDFKQITFKDIKHPLRLSQKYKFNINNFENPIEDEKSIWLNMNYDETNKGASAILRRCNGTLGFLVENRTLEWYEPAIIENDFSYTNIDFNTAIKVPQDELYVTVQYNEYTKNIAVSDRFIIGALDFKNIANNIAFKVKAVHRLGTSATYQTNTISFIKLVLDRDSINVEDDYIYKEPNGKIHYIANYKTIGEQDGITVSQDNNYYLKISPNTSIIYEGETIGFECNLYDQNQVVEATLSYNFELPMTDKDNLYYEVQQIDNNHFNVTNLHKYYKSDLVVTVSLVENDGINVEPLIFNIQLGEPL